MASMDDREQSYRAAELRRTFLDLHRPSSLVSGICRLVSLMGKGAAYMPMTGETMMACDWTHVPAQTWVWEHRLRRRGVSGNWPG